MDHLLLHCEKPHWSWSCVLNLLGFRGSYQEQFQECFLVDGIGWGSRNLVLLCLLWCLWKERNQQTCEDLDSFSDHLLASFSGSLFDFSQA